MRTWTLWTVEQVCAVWLCAAQVCAGNGSTSRVAARFHSLHALRREVSRGVVTNASQNALRKNGAATTTLTRRKRKSAMDAVNGGGGAERLSFREFEHVYREGKAKNGAVKNGHIGQSESCPVVSSCSTVERDLGNLAPPGPVGHCVVERLQRKFGLGDHPKKRLVLYRRLEELAAVHGDRVLALISEAVCQAVGKDKPGRYFCRSICAKLAEAGVTTKGAVGDATW